MSGKEIVDRLVLVSYGASLFFSVLIAFRKVPRIHRVFPILWQIAFAVVIFFPMLHGFPSEWFFVLMMVSGWSGVALISSYFLYRQPLLIAKILAFVQFIQCVSAVFVTAVGYISAYWRY